jgi:hypothetical protein
MLSLTSNRSTGCGVLPLIKYIYSTNMPFDDTGLAIPVKADQRWIIFTTIGANPGFAHTAFDWNHFRFQ